MTWPLTGEYADVYARACAETCQFGAGPDIAGLPGMGFLLVGLLFAASYRYGRLHATRSDDAEAEALDAKPPASNHEPTTADQ